MKKVLLFYLFCVFFVLLSCSNDEYKNEENMILPKTLTAKYSKSSNVDVTNFVYDGNKIITATRKFTRSEYFYDGDKIVKEIKYSSELGKEEKISETKFTYENDKLIVVHTTEYGTQYKYLYNYKKDGTIVKETYEVSRVTGKEVKNAGNEVLLFSNGNLVKKTSNSEADSLIYTRTCVYNYDSSENPFKNVLGFDLLLGQISFDLEGNLSANNNLKNMEIYSSDQFGNTHNEYINSFKYEYNSKGYPIKKTSYGMEGMNAIIEYKY
ncbi:hypothetical protein [Flavobacterium sp. 3-210]